MKRVYALATTVAVIGFFSFGTATSALAYWDFQGNLPTPGGSYIYVKTTNAFGGTGQQVRMSWTYGSHYMRYLKIYPSGTWYYIDVHGADPNECPGADFDCYAAGTVSSPDDKFGCYNPPGLSTVWVNCRATNPI